MRRTLIVLSWTLAGLMACERALSLHDRAERQSSSRLRRLVSPTLLEGKSVAAIRVEDTSHSEALLYVRTSGGWRCLSRSGAPADESRLMGFVEEILEAQGILQNQDTGRFARFGLDPPHLLRVSLHGSRALQDRGHDLIAVVDIGATLPGGRGTYARPGMSREVIAVDTDLRRAVAWPKAVGLAPFVDPRIVPAAWSASASVERIEVHPHGSAPFELRRRPRAAKREELRAGAVPWDWVLVAGGRERTTPPGVSNAYAAFLQSATYNLALGQPVANGLGLAQPRARVVLHSAEGQVVEIQIGDPAPMGGVAVKNALTRSVFAVDAEVAALLTPRAEAFRRDVKTNPWDARLRALTAGPDEFH